MEIFSLNIELHLAFGNPDKIYLTHLEKLQLS